MMSKTANNTGGVSVQEELLPLKSGVPAGVAMLPHTVLLEIQNESQIGASSKA